MTLRDLLDEAPRLGYPYVMDIPIVYSNGGCVENVIMLEIWRGVGGKESPMLYLDGWRPSEVSAT